MSLRKTRDLLTTGEAIQNNMQSDRPRYDGAWHVDARCQRCCAPKGNHVWDHGTLFCPEYALREAYGR